MIAHVFGMIYPSFFDRLICSLSDVLIHVYVMSFLFLDQKDRFKAIDDLA